MGVKFGKKALWLGYVVTFRLSESQKMETNGIAETAVRRVKQRKAIAMVQSGLCDGMSPEEKKREILGLPPFGAPPLKATPRPGLVGPPGFHTTVREPKRAHLRVPVFKNTTKINEKTPREGRKERICAAGEGKKKSEILGCPAKGGPGRAVPGRAAREGRSREGRSRGHRT